jgi:hypothetical protein
MTSPSPGSPVPSLFGNPYAAGLAGGVAPVQARQTGTMSYIVTVGAVTVGIVGGVSIVAVGGAAFADPAGPPASPPAVTVSGGVGTHEAVPPPRAPAPAVGTLDSAAPSPAIGNHAGGRTAGRGVGPGVPGPQPAPGTGPARDAESWSWSSRPGDARTGPVARAREAWFTRPRAIPVSEVPAAEIPVPDVLTSRVARPPFPTGADATGPAAASGAAWSARSAPGPRGDRRGVAPRPDHGVVPDLTGGSSWFVTPPAPATGVPRLRPDHRPEPVAAPGSEDADGDGVVGSPALRPPGRGGPSAPS